MLSPLYLLRDQGIFKTAAKNGAWKYSEVEISAELVTLLACDFIMDLGANQGL